MLEFGQWLTQGSGTLSAKIVIEESPQPFKSTTSLVTWFNTVSNIQSVYHDVLNLACINNTVLKKNVKLLCDMIQHLTSVASIGK